MKGLVRRVGPGNCDIWSTNWLGGSRPRKPIFRPEHSVVSQVQDLFVPGLRSWDENLVRGSFAVIDAEEYLHGGPNVMGFTQSDHATNY